MTANAFARRLASLERQVRSLATAPQLGHSTVDDGFLRFRDLEGNIGIRVGLQPDGSYTTIVVNAPTPLQPTDPLVVAGALAANVTWDGNLIGPDGTVDAELEQFATDRSCEIHAGQTEGFVPDRSTLVGEIHNKAGGTAEVGLLGGQWWIRLMVRNEANEHGPPSVSVPVTIEPLVDGEQFDELEGRLGEAAERIRQAQEVLDRLDEETLPGLALRLGETEADLATLTEETLPGLSVDLGDARDRLDAAFGPGASYDVGDAVSTARQAAIDAAAVTAQQKADAAEAAAEAAAATHAELVAAGAEEAAIAAAALDAEAKAAAAQAAAEAAAKGYTDDAVSPLVTRLTAAEGVLNNLDETTLPALSARLSGAEGALDSAFPSGPFNVSDSISTQTSAAQQAAIDAAAQDAEAKANAAQSAAEQAAATHANLVAQGAEEAAIQAAAADAETKANAAQQAAEEAAQGYADAALAQATTVAEALAAQVAADSGKVWRQPTPPPAGTFHRWTGDPHASTSEKVVDGEVVATNWMPAPIAASETGWQLTSPGNAIKSVENLGDGGNLALRGTHPANANTSTPCLITPAFGIPGGGQYRFGIETWKYAQETPKTARVEVRWQGESGAMPGNTFVRFDMLADESHKVTHLEVEAPEGAVGAIVILFWGGGVAGLVEGDYLQLRDWYLTSGDGGFLHGDSPDDRANDLWINTTPNDGGLPANTPNTWDSAANEWAPASDTAIQEALEAAQGAQETADAAMATANGKNLVTYTDVTAANKPGPTPTDSFGSGRTTNDIHRNRNASTGEIYAEWLWSGSTWQVVNFGDAILRSLDVGKLTAGSAAIQTAVIEKLTAGVADIIELNAGRITSGTIDTARLNTTELAAGLATILQLDAAVIVSGQIDTARLNTADLAASLATIIDLNAERIVAGTIDTARLNASEIAAAVADIIELNAGRITAGTIDTARLNASEIAAAVADIIELNAGRITAGTIDTARLNATEIAAAVGEFLEINANQIKTGVLEAVVTLSGTFQTATSGTRTQINNAGLYHYGASGTLDFSATSAGVLVLGEFRTGVGSNGITISPDSSRLGNGLIEFRSSVTPVNAEVSLVAGTGGASTLQMRGPAIAGITNSPASLDLTWRGSSSTSQADLQGHQVTASGKRTIIYATGSSVGDAGGLTLESMAYGGGTDRSRPGVEVKALYTKFTRSGSTGTTEVNVDGDLTVAHGAVIEGAASIASSLHIGGYAEVTDGELRIGPDASYTGQSILRLSRSAVLDSPAGSANIDFKSRGNVYLHAGVGGTGNNWTSSTGYIYVHGNNGGFYGARETISNAANVFSNTSGRIYRSTSLREAKVAIEAVTDEQWRKVKLIEPVTYYDRRQAELRAELIEGGVNDEDVEALTQQVGFIAEQVEEAGVVGLPIYGEDGALSGLGYERITAHHQMWHKEHDTRLDAIEQRLAAFEG